jgi:hypothetical protein
MRKGGLQRRVLADSRWIYEAGPRTSARAIDRRVLAKRVPPAGLEADGHLVEVGPLVPPSGNVSPTAGTAVDIAKINGIPIIGHQGAG